ncbi:MAG: HEAT repeat domain-containing protein [Candidatus Eisenbacteria bacterium]|nr:HEAT repeat domain-containing protein [Candidatus Eisenbacteria bacterium]
MTNLSQSSERFISLRELSPYAQHTAVWLRSLARALKMFRLYRSENPVVIATREQIASKLAELVNQHGAMDLRFTPSEIHLVDEPVIRPGVDSDENLRATELQLPFQVYRDGIRRIVILPEVPLAEIYVLFDALRVTGVGPETQDDLVTLLWQGNLTHIQSESVPLEQTIYLSVHRGSEGGGGHRGLSYAWSPVGSEIRADLGQQLGAQGLHRDTFDDWALCDSFVDVPTAYHSMEAGFDESRVRLMEEWRDESACDWAGQTPGIVQRLLELDPGDGMRTSLVQALVTWLAGALQRCDWEEAQRSLAMLRQVDPQSRWTCEAMTAALSGLGLQEIAQRLDEDDARDQARFSSLMVAIGQPAVGLTCSVMCLCTKVRPRAAASTAICYMCSDHPEWLAPFVADSRWQMVRNVVFVLGQIGGAAVVPLLEEVCAHSELRVRRALVQALGNVPCDVRLPMLLEQLHTRDPQLLAATLNMLTRERNPRVARAILARIQAPDFESRSEENKRALFNGLSEVADDHTVPALEQLLTEGGWFARRTVARVAAARTLRRIGTETAVAVLEAGLRSKSEAVRSACLDAMSSRMNS